MEASHPIAHNPVPDSAAVIIQDQIARLTREHPWILNCQAHVEVPAPYRSDLYQIQILLTLPERLLVVDRIPPVDSFQEDIYVAIWSAFDLARQKIRDYRMVPSSQRRQLQYR
jgi:hypothetical protein